MGRRSDGLLSLQTLFLLGLVASQVACSALPWRKRAYAAPGMLWRGYHTEPDFLPQKIELEYMTNDTSKISNDYIFLSLMLDLGATWGGQIYDARGNLVWFGNPFSRGRVQDFKTCDYLGSKRSHLCWSEREIDPAGDHPISHKVFVDNTYNSVQNISSRGDGHEFRVVDNGRTFLTMEYKHVMRDLRAYYGPEQGWIKDACLLEYDTEMGKVIFEWCYSDHLPLWETRIFFPNPYQPNVTANKFGQGLIDAPWDFAHMNAIDKNSEGDYITSLRHLDQILKIAGPNSASGKEAGSILWRLGGKANEFDKEFNFTKQHDVRYVSTNSSETRITLFNNAWEGVNEPTASASSGQLISVNNETMKASLVQDFIHPYGKLAGSKGSMQLLDNGNVFLGWGEHPEFTEFTVDGTPLSHAKFAMSETNQYSYRVHKFPWTGRPTNKPKLIAYSYQCLSSNTPMYAYVSWNGATEVKKWRVSTAMRATEKFKAAGVFARKGFETQIEISPPALFVQVDALDANDTVLDGVVQQTYVPGLDMKIKCGPDGCPPHTVYEHTHSRAEQCSPVYWPGLIPMLVALACIEVASYLLQQMLAYGVWIGFNSHDWQTMVEELRGDFTPLNRERDVALTGDKPGCESLHHTS